jgi:hypothetical protein
MKVNSFAEDRRGLTRRQLLDLPLSPALDWRPRRRVFPKPKLRLSQENSTNHSKISNTTWRGVKAGSARAARRQNLKEFAHESDIHQKVQEPAIRRGRSVGATDALEEGF